MHYKTPNVDDVTVVATHGRKKSARGDVKSLITSKIESLVGHNFFDADRIEGSIDPAELSLYDENDELILHVCYEVKTIEDIA